MINPANFPDWQFEFFQYQLNQNRNRQRFTFKSPRLNKPFYYNSITNEDSDEALREYEKECYLNQVMWPVAGQIQGLQDDLRRQFKLHIDRGIPLPSELKACIDLKIV